MKKKKKKGEHCDLQSVAEIDSAFPIAPHHISEIKKENNQATLADVKENIQAKSIQRVRSAE